MSELMDRLKQAVLDGDEDEAFEQRIKSGRGAGHMGGRGNAFMQLTAYFSFRQEET